MKNKEKRLYEGIYLFDPVLTPDNCKKELDAILDGITKLDGEVCKVHDLKRKTLAYEIKNREEAHYFLVYFKLTPENIKTLWDSYRYNQSLLRFMTILADKVVEQIEFKTLKTS